MSNLRKLRRSIQRSTPRYNLNPLLRAAMNEYRKRNKITGPMDDSALMDELKAIGVATPESTPEQWFANPDWDKRCRNYLEGNNHA